MPTVLRAEEGDQALPVSAGYSVTVVDDAQAASSWLQYDEIDDDVNADQVVASQVHNANDTVVDDADSDSVVASQSQGKSDTVVDDVDADSVLALASFGLISTIIDDVNADSVLASQIQAAVDTIVDDIDAAASVVSQILNANDTVVSDADASSDAEPGVFINDVNGTSTVVKQTLHATVVLVDDVDASASILSDEKASAYSDVIEDDVNADSSIQLNLRHAYQLVVNDIDVAVEIINDTAGEAWVFNAWTQAFSRYTGFDVNHVASLDGVPTFVTPTGVYRFSSSVFADAKVRFGLNNFGVPQTKRLRAVYMTTVGTGVVKMATFHGLTGALVQHNYATPSQSSDVPINRRISPARGDQGQYWGLQFELTGGARQEAHSIRILPLVTGRNL